MTRDKMIDDAARAIGQVTGQAVRRSPDHDGGTRLDVGGTVHVVIFPNGVCWFGDDDGDVGTQFDNPAATILANPDAWTIPRWLGEQGIDEDMFVYV